MDHQAWLRSRRLALVTDIRIESISSGNRATVVGLLDFELYDNVKSVRAYTITLRPAREKNILPG
jgi:hypothetical protein